MVQYEKKNGAIATNITDLSRLILQELKMFLPHFCRTDLASSTLLLLLLLLQGYTPQD
jgi:hypothetical protein